MTSAVQATPLKTNLDNEIVKKSYHSSCSDVFFVSTQDRKTNQTNSIDDTCPRCNQVVYAFEKIGPIKDHIYHKTCFKCIVCGRQLDLRSYFINTVDLLDANIYCQSHVPKCRKGHVHADNFHIRNIMQAPKLSVIQHLNLPKPTVDGMSVGILHAVNAQNLLHSDKINQREHHFPVMPPEIRIATNNQICQMQRDIELKQKQEEDELYKKFFEERKRQHEQVEKEIDNEWKSNLTELCQKYESYGKTEEELSKNTSEFITEKQHLQKDLTIKRNRKKLSIKESLLERERKATAELVTRQSKEMLTWMEMKRIELMKEQGLDLPIKEPPPPLPPTKKKVELYSNVNDLSHVDSVAIKIAESEHQSYTELVQKLTSGFDSDLEKARWITVKDLNMMEFNDDEIIDESPMWLLRGIKYGTETYHTLFMRLCSYAGLYCVNIKGHSKSFGYEPGLSIHSGQFLNTWNAVLINNEWRFVQCNWGARHLVMCKDVLKTNVQNVTNGGDKIEYEYDEHYFLTDPEHFIFEFFPFDPSWQLLDEPITLKDFEKLPFVRSLFFHYSMSFVNQFDAVVKADERGACDIQFRIPDTIKNYLIFHSQLRVLPGSTLLSNPVSLEMDRIGNSRLENFVLHTVEDNIVSFNVHLPKRGVYYLELFANTISKDKSIFGQTFKLRCVCKYKLICNELKQRMHALPQCANGEWGPEKAVRHYNWKCISHKCAIIEIVNQDLFVLFQLPKKLKVHCKLITNDPNIQNICDSVHTHYTIVEKGCLVLIIEAHLPSKAQYGLDIYAYDPDESKEKRIMSHCCKYLINRSSSFPHTIIGDNKNGINYNAIVPISHVKPEIELQSNKNDLKMFFVVSHDYTLEASLKFEGDTSQNGLSTSKHLLINRSNENITVKLYIPWPGRYILTIFARYKEESIKEITPIYGYAIRKRPRFNGQ